ncbi:DUF2884 family protein [Pseudoxanthomonas putridarboris]|uniref:DUF2884 family protein n=1 Tax=Pseudoxanthomonas putridarboris TaxID=752605 RepID=A0ABU9J0Y2_9GAMM
MKTITILSIALSVLLLAACGPGPDTGSQRSTALWGKNITLTATGQPKAEITAKGEFIVGGKTVEVNDAQRALLVAYHRELGGIADAGIATGKEGVKLAGKAVGAAVKGVFSGNPEQIEQEIEAEAKKVEAHAMKICERLPALYQAQQDLAAALPAFAPYAAMDLDDVTDCRQDIEEDGDAAARANAAATAI